MQPSLSVNLIRFLYELFSHNYIAIAYFLSFLIALFYAVRKPTRTSLLLTIAFALLLFNFEYEKHIAEALRDQTQMSLTQGSTSGFRKLRSLVQIFTEFFVPVGIFALGWAFIMWSLFIGIWKDQKSDR